MTQEPAVQVAPARFVTIELASTLTGFSPGAIRTKIARGVWVERREWVRAPDSRVLIDLPGVNAYRAAWVRAKAEMPARSRAAKREDNASRRTRKVAWADRAAIRAFYVEAKRLTDETGVPHHVDHVLPLHGRLVSGLHVHQNLQVLTGSDNSRKRNRFEPC